MVQSSINHDFSAPKKERTGDGRSRDGCHRVGWGMGLLKLLSSQHWETHVKMP